ncbi:hypothetical protein B296_00011646 [Ensete ventricosum]|uniref:Uncharacterized protein n=1 Tax=Ensete ventricosum TaxID=4639 RepID=A0A427AQY3_ENSVE|nr:hypothetical protein B296_00011646 [Ensete ventricosum]
MKPRGRAEAKRKPRGSQRTCTGRRRGRPEGDSAVMENQRLRVLGAWRGMPPFLLKSCNEHVWLDLCILL